MKKLLVTLFILFLTVSIQANENKDDYGKLVIYRTPSIYGMATKMKFVINRSLIADLKMKDHMSLDLPEGEYLVYFAGFLDSSDIGITTWEANLVEVKRNETSYYETQPGSYGIDLVKKDLNNDNLDRLVDISRIK